MVNRPGRTEPGTAGTHQGTRVGKGLGSLAAVVAGSFLSCWPMGMGELSSRFYPPLEEVFELAFERGHSLKGLPHPERSHLHVNRREQGARSS